MRSGSYFKTISFIALVIGCFGCAPGHEFTRVQPTSTHAVIYVYRTTDPVSSNLEPDITCGHTTVAIVSGGYYTFVEDPGTTACYASSDPSSRIEFETRPEAEYFVSEKVAAGVTNGRVTLKQVSNTTGMDEIQSCNYTVK
jgi:hypothetical protein